MAREKSRRFHAEPGVFTSHLTLLDRIAALTIDPDAAFADLHAMYASDPCLHT